MIGRINRLFLTVGIVTVAIGCDNVSWGGMRVGLEGPPVDSLAIPADSMREGSSSMDSAPTYDLGPLLYAGFRQGDSAVVVPVAELTAEGLRPLPPEDPEGGLTTHLRAAHVPMGSELTLFHQGLRIGTMTVGDTLGLRPEYCSPRPGITGVLELIPSAGGVEGFMALEGPSAREHPFQPFRAPESAYGQRIASLNLGGEALNEVRARWPGRLADIRQDLQVFQLPGGEAPAVIATFLFQDQLQVQAAPDEAYSLLILGEPRGNQFERSYTWYRRVGEDGKGAPRFFSRFDWDGDGEEEVLLEVMGTDSRWWAALDRQGGTWTLAFQDPCGAPGAQEGTSEPGDPTP